MAYVIDIERKQWGRSYAHILTATSKRGERYKLKRWLWNSLQAEALAERVRKAQRTGAWLGPKYPLWWKEKAQQSDSRY